VGRLCGGRELLEQLNAVRTDVNDAPQHRLRIARCGFTNAGAWVGGWTGWGVLGRCWAWLVAKPTFQLAPDVLLSASDLPDGSLEDFGEAGPGPNQPFRTFQQQLLKFWHTTPIFGPQMAPWRALRRRGQGPADPFASLNSNASHFGTPLPFLPPDGSLEDFDEAGAGSGGNKKETAEEAAARVKLEAAKARESVRWVGGWMTAGWVLPAGVCRAGLVQCCVLLWVGAVFAGLACAPCGLSWVQGQIKGSLMWGACVAGSCC